MIEESFTCGAGENDPTVLPALQVFVVVVDATVIPVGNGSFTETFVRFEISADDAASTSVRVDVPPGAMFAGVNVLVTVGGAFPETTSVCEPPIVLVAEQPLPKLFPTFTVKKYDPGGVSVPVVIVNVVDPPPLALETVVGLNAPLTSVGGPSVKFSVTGIETQPAPVPDHVVLTTNVAELP